MAQDNTRAAQVGATAAQFLPATNPFLGLLPSEMWGKVKDFFMYTASFTPLAAGSTANVTTPIQADSDFLLTTVNGVVFDTTDTTVQANPRMLVTLLDAGAGRQLSDAAVHWLDFIGTGQLPGILPFPKILRASSQLRTTVQNLDGATAYNVRIAYVGFKVFGFA